MRRECISDNSAENALIFFDMGYAFNLLCL